MDNAIVRKDKKGITYQMLKYDLLSTASNGFIFFFGVVFPIFMSIVIIKGALSDVPAQFKKDAVTSVFLGMALIIPMATLFMGYAASYSEELEKQVPLRMRLFGFSQKRLVISKLIANYIYMTLALVLYAVADVLLIGEDLYKPKILPLLATILIIYVLAGILMFMAHGICNFIQKFGLSYGVVLGLYFVFMALGSLMGVQVESMPVVLQKIAKLLPFQYIGSSGFVEFWKGGSYNIVPLVQAMIFLGSISMLVLLGSFAYRGRKAK